MENLQHLSFEVSKEHLLEAQPLIHESTVLNNQVLKCEKCFYKTTRKFNLQQHVWRKHAIPKEPPQPKILPKCTYCEFSSEHSHNVRRHEETCSFSGPEIFCVLWNKHLTLKAKDLFFGNCAEERTFGFIGLLSHPEFLTWNVYAGVQPQHGRGSVLQPGGRAQQEPRGARGWPLLRAGPAGEPPQRRGQLPLQAVLPRGHGRGGGQLQRVDPDLQPRHRQQHRRIPGKY